MAFTISSSPRVRPSPFYHATIADGVVSFTTYNHMMMPTSYGDPMAEYWRLINGVAMWDVAVERQVQLKGPDAGRLAQVLVPRNLSKLKVGRGWYVPVCDHDGILINDPVLLKLAEDLYWFSIADQDMLFWARAIAGERKLDVEVTEPDVSPLAIQGPMAEDVVASLFDESIRDIGHFRFREMELEGIPLIVARSGWSKQGGFELYLRDASRGLDLWHMVKQAGEPWDIGPGSPNPMERVESGLLSWGGDTDDQTTPFEVGMGRFVHTDLPDDIVGIKALRRIKERGQSRDRLGVVLDIEGEIGYYDRKGKVFKGTTDAGHITATCWSPRLERNIGICLVGHGVSPGDTVTVDLPDGRQCQGEMTSLPFL
ncbi:MAG: glycine cleavage T C-terminal barrel domain-containing protein [Pseudomonadota bacterium]